MQVVLQASSPRFVRWVDRLQILVQFAVLQVIDWPDGSSTATALPWLQHATKLQTSSNPSLEIVPGGFAHKPLSVVNGRHVDEVSSCAGPGVVRRPRKKIIRTGMMSIEERRRICEPSLVGSEPECSPITRCLHTSEMTNRLFQPISINSFDMPSCLVLVMIHVIVFCVCM